MIGPFLAAALAAQTAPVPPPVEQATADCVHPVYATDMLVCGDAGLHRLDDRLREVWASSPEEVPPARLLEARTDWFRRSRRCAFQVEHRACVAAAYEEALAVASVREVARRTAGRCRLADGSAATSAEVANGAALVQEGRIVAIALPDAPAWRPFLRYELGRGRLVFRTLDDQVAATCLSK